MPCSSLYIHVPFCISKCPYCDFYSVPYDEWLAEIYTKQICTALKNSPFAIEPLKTVYFGGGTPSLLYAEQIGRIIGAASRFGFDETEITVECNPGAISSDGFALLRDVGVNRISMGLQSADDRLLKELGRIHTLADAEQAIEWAQAAQFDNISLDVMLGLPEQSPEDIVRSVRFCRAHNADHVSAYLLKLEDGTPFAEPEVRMRCPDEDAQADMYIYAVRALEAHGYKQYEISNFARDGKISHHNNNYWDCGEYLGLGPSAHSFVDGKRFSFPPSVGRFLRAEDVYIDVINEGEGGSVSEYLMLRLRLTEGVLWDDLYERFPENKKMREEIEEGADLLSGLDLIEMDEIGLRLTLQGFPVSNAVIATLIP